LVKVPVALEEEPVLEAMVVLEEHREALPEVAFMVHQVEIMAVLVAVMVTLAALVEQVQVEQFV